MSDSFATNPARVVPVTILSVFCFVALVAVIFRLWARKVQRARWELNDYLCVVGLIFALALSLFTIHSQVYWDLGGDLTQKGNPQAVLALIILQVKAMLVGEILWAVSVFFVRASVLQLYIHLFHSTRSFRITCYVVHAVNFGYFSAIVLAACLICRPIAFNWDPTIPGGVCGDQKSLDIFIGVFNLVIDVVVVILPMPVLWGLQMGTRKKIILSLIFGMGIVICVLTLIRIWVTSLIRGDSNSQKIYSIIALLTCLEALLGTVNACLPVMKPVFSKFSDTKLYSFFSNAFPTLSSSTYGRYSHGAANSSGQKPSREGYKIKNKAVAGVFGTNKDLQVWPSTVSTTPGSPDSKIHRFVDNKAAQIMFSHTTASTGTSKPGSPNVDATANPPRPPPKSKYYRPDRQVGEKGELEIVVKKDWDVERGERENSNETARELLKEDQNGRPW